MRPEDIAFEPAFDRSKGRDAVRVRWLGTAGFEVSHAQHPLLIDPYLTRASLFDCVRAPLRSDLAAIRAYTPRADVIVAGQTHFDHVLDVPAIAWGDGRDGSGLALVCEPLPRREGARVAARGRRVPG